MTAYLNEKDRRRKEKCRTAEVNLEEGIKRERNRIINLPAMKMEEESLEYKGSLTCLISRNSLRKELLKQITDFKP